MVRLHIYRIPPPLRLQWFTEDSSSNKLWKCIFQRTTSYANWTRPSPISNRVKFLREFSNITFSIQCKEQI